jgi:hypothetical protein
MTLDLSLDFHFTGVFPHLLTMQSIRELIVLVNKDREEFFSLLSEGQSERRYPLINPYLTKDR